LALLALFLTFQEDEKYAQVLLDVPAIPEPDGPVGAYWYPESGAAEFTPLGGGIVWQRPGGNWVLAVAGTPLLDEISGALRPA
jgi:hypothetical protein